MNRVLEIEKERERKKEAEGESMRTFAHVPNGTHCTTIIERTKKIFTRSSAFRRLVCGSTPPFTLFPPSSEFFLFRPIVHELSKVQLVSCPEYRRDFLSEFSDRAKFRRRSELSSPLYPFETNYRKILLKNDKKKKPTNVSHFDEQKEK